MNLLRIIKNYYAQGKTEQGDRRSEAFYFKLLKRNNRKGKEKL